MNIYEPLDAHASDFKDIRKILTEADGAPRVDAVRDALERIAANLSGLNGATDTDRDNLAKLYRGTLAASRILACLREKTHGAG